MKLSKHLETVTNLVVLIVALVLVWVLTTRYLIPNFTGSRSSAAAVRVGDKLADIPGFKWPDSQQTLVMALAPGCDFCTLSMPFYRRIAEAASRKELDTHVIALFSEKVSLEDGKAYLQSHGVTISDVATASFDTLRIPGTPTLLLVGDRGIVVQTWAGKLPIDREGEVWSKLRSAGQPR